MVFQVIKSFFALFFCVFLPSLLLLLGLYCFCPFLCPSLHEIFLWYLQFSWRDLVFPLLLFSFTSFHCSLKKALCLSSQFSGTLHSVQYTFPYFPLLSTSLLSSAICKASSDNHFAFLHFLFFGMVLVSATCTVLLTSAIVLQALCLPDLIPWIYSSPPLETHRGFD